MHCYPSLLLETSKFDVPVKSPPNFSLRLIPLMESEIDNLSPVPAKKRLDVNRMNVDITNSRMIKRRTKIGLSPQKRIFFAHKYIKIMQKEGREILQYVSLGLDSIKN